MANLGTTRTSNVVQRTNQSVIAAAIRDTGRWFARAVANAIVHRVAHSVVGNKPIRSGTLKTYMLLLFDNLATRAGHTCVPQSLLPSDSEPKSFPNQNLPFNSVHRSGSLRFPGHFEPRKPSSIPKRNPDRKKPQRWVRRKSAICPCPSAWSLFLQ